MIQKKVCMVGMFATGKTSLVRRFVHATFSDRYLSTVGVKVDRKPVQVGEREVTLLLWDLEGRDEVQDLQVSYLRGASGILFVMDGTRPETLQQTHELRDTVERAVGPVPAALAINKADLTDQWAVSDADERALRALPWHVFTTSARTGDGVEAAFLHLAETIVQAP